MRRPVLVFALWAFALPAFAQPKPGPRKVDVLRQLQHDRTDVKSVSDALEDIGDGRYPVLYVTAGKDCIHRVIDGQREESCSPTTLPHVAVVRRAADASLAVEATLDLPLEAAPWDVPDEMQWGIHFIKDYDLDGKPELMLAYGYHGPMVWAVGDTWYKHWCIINLDKLTMAIHEVVNVSPQAGSATLVESKWKLVPAKDGAPAITVTTSTGDYDERKGERVFRETVKTYRYDPAADRWVAAK
jgi:hypothetical protein